MHIPRNRRCKNRGEQYSDACATVETNSEKSRVPGISGAWETPEVAFRNLGLRPLAEKLQRRRSQNARSATPRGFSHAET